MRIEYTLQQNDYCCLLEQSGNRLPATAELRDHASSVYCASRCATRLGFSSDFIKAVGSVQVSWAATAAATATTVNATTIAAGIETDLFSVCSVVILTCTTKHNNNIYKTLLLDNQSILEMCTKSLDRLNCL